MKRKRQEKTTSKRSRKKEGEKLSSSDKRLLSKFSKRCDRCQIYYDFINDNFNKYMKSMRRTTDEMEEYLTTFLEDKEGYSFDVAFTMLERFSTSLEVDWTNDPEGFKVSVNELLWKCWNEFIDYWTEQKIDQEKLTEVIKVAKKYDSKNKLKVKTNDQSVLKDVVEYEIKEFEKSPKINDYLSIIEKLNKLKDEEYIKKKKDDMIKTANEYKYDKVLALKVFNEEKMFKEMQDRVQILENNNYPLIDYIDFVDVLSEQKNDVHREFVLEFADKHVRSLYKELLFFLENRLGLTKESNEKGLYKKFVEWKDEGFPPPRDFCGEWEDTQREFDPEKDGESEFRDGHYMNVLANDEFGGVDEFTSIEYDLCCDKYMDENDHENILKIRPHVPGNLKWVVDHLINEAKVKNKLKNLKYLLRIVYEMLDKKEMQNWVKKRVKLPKTKLIYPKICKHVEIMRGVESQIEDTIFDVMEFFENFKENKFFSNFFNKN